MLTAVALLFAAVAPAQVVSEPFNGWDGAAWLRAAEVGIDVVVVPEVGGRVMRFARDGENIIYEHPGSGGQTLTAGWFMVGGHQFDVGPESRGVPAHQRLWLGPYRREDRDGMLVVTSEDEIGLRLDKRIALEAATGDLWLEQGLTAVGDAPRDACGWSRTLCRGGGFIILPLATASRFPAGWCTLGQRDGQPWCEGEHPTLAETERIGDTLVAHAVGSGAKLGCDAPDGWIAYACGTLLLVVRQAWTAGDYGDAGCTIEAFYSDAVAELEPLGPMARIAPGERHALIQRWRLLRLDQAPATAADAAALRPLIEATVAGMDR